MTILHFLSLGKILFATFLFEALQYNGSHLFALQINDFELENIFN